jgi:hypothetical protein
VSIGLTPVSFALTAPLAALAGQEATLVGAGVIGAVATLALFYGIEDVRRDAELFPERAPDAAALEQRGEVVGEARVADVRSVHPHDLDAFSRR